MLTEKSEIFIPGPAGRIHAKYNKSNKKSAPIKGSKIKNERIGKFII